MLSEKLQSKMRKSFLFVVFFMALVFAWVEAGNFAGVIQKLVTNKFKLIVFRNYSLFRISVTEKSNLTHPLIMGPHCHIQPGVDESNCYWKGSSPFCVSGDACPYGFSLICKHACGDGKCCWTGNKSLCCPIPGESI